MFFLSSWETPLRRLLSNFLFFLGIYFISLKAFKIFSFDFISFSFHFISFPFLILTLLSFSFHMLQWYWYFWAWIHIYSWYLETIFNFKTFLFLISIKFFSNIAVFLLFCPMELHSNISGVFKWSSMCLKGFPFVSAVKNRDIGDLGSIPGSGRSPGGGNGNPL